ncbi:uncharacterized protein LOC122708566 [Cervus elaphus]|uniref:uncharacterized protein LOC122708566 n=1 Tax=Cervus elaphus TaxID=9860 RepID=UPI001CC30730|nr:uncharacterized protein LOC122708566 [Cervus elaphus]
MQGARPDSELTGRGRGGARENPEGCLQARPVFSPASAAHQGTAPALRIRAASVHQGRVAAGGDPLCPGLTVGCQAPPPAASWESPHLYWSGKTGGAGRGVGGNDAPGKEVHHHRKTEWLRPHRRASGGSLAQLLVSRRLGRPWGHLTHFPEAALRRSVFGERPSPGRAEGGSLTFGAGDVCPEQGAPSCSGPAWGSEARGLRGRSPGPGWHPAWGLRRRAGGGHWVWRLLHVDPPASSSSERTAPASESRRWLGPRGKAAPGGGDPDAVYSLAAALHLTWGKAGLPCRLLFSCSSITWLQDTLSARVKNSTLWTSLGHAETRKSPCSAWRRK